MKIFEINKAFSYTVIIGCGRLGANLANKLSDEGKNILIMDNNKNAFHKLSSSFGGLSIIGDGTDYDDLNEAQIYKADIVIVVTNNDNTNAMISQLVKEIFKVKCVISRLYDSEREYIYREFDINTICPSSLSTIEIEKIINKTEETNEINKNISNYEESEK